MSQQPSQAQRYQQALIASLRTRDPRVFAQFLLSAGRGTPEFVKDPRRLEEAMHRFILTFPELSDLHEESRQWLNARPGPPMNPGRGGV